MLVTIRRMESEMNSALKEAVNGFLFNRSEQERTGKQRDMYRDALREWLMTDGEVDESGHRWLVFENPLTIEGRSWRAITAQRRLSSSIDLDAVEAWAKTNGFMDEVFPIVERREFDEDALYALNQRGLVSDEVLDSFITESETFAIVPVKS